MYRMIDITDDTNTTITHAEELDVSLRELLDGHIDHIELHSHDSCVTITVDNIDRESAQWFDREIPLVVKLTRNI